jgi:peptide deformylase
MSAIKKDTKLKVSDVILQKGEDCSDYLTVPLFQVNMRLYNTLDGYRKVVSAAINHMKSIMKNDKFVDYPELAGISGANVGIPWNIVVVRTTGRKSDMLTMINPVVCSVSRKKITVHSNCGSLNLPKAIPVERREWVEVSYFDENGKKQMSKFSSPAVRVGTIQHEIDHNRGVLITDTHRHL